MMSVGQVKPPLYILRLIPIGFLTVWMGVLSYLAAIEGKFSLAVFGVSLVYGLPVSAITSLMAIVPLSLVWIIAFEAGRTRFPVLRQRATVASGISAAIGVIVTMFLLRQLTGEPESPGLMSVPVMILPVGVAMALTWRSFGKDRTHV